MNAAIANLALSANIRMRNPIARHFTINEVASALGEEEARIDSKIDGLFVKRGSNPIPDEKVWERECRK